MAKRKKRGTKGKQTAKSGGASSPTGPLAPSSSQADSSSRPPAAQPTTPTNDLSLAIQAPEADNAQSPGQNSVYQSTRQENHDEAAATEARGHPSPSAAQQPFAEQTTPAIARSGRKSSIPVENAPPLQMVHRCQVDRSVFPPRYTQGKLNRFINKASKLYHYGGEAQRVTDADGQTFDVMICDQLMCTFCQNRDENRLLSEAEAKRVAAQAEDADHIDAATSVMVRLPFVHTWHDCYRVPELNPDERWVFRPQPPKPTNQPHLPTWTTRVLFNDLENGAEDDDGCAGWRVAGMCNPALCDICSVVDMDVVNAIADGRMN